MTAIPPLTQEIDTAPGTGAEVRCAVCEHALADHDVISRRYCEATQANALPRNCICPAA